MFKCKQQAKARFREETRKQPEKPVRSRSPRGYLMGNSRMNPINHGTNFGFEAKAKEERQSARGKRLVNYGSAKEEMKKAMLDQMQKDTRPVQRYRKGYGVDYLKEVEANPFRSKKEDLGQSSLLSNFQAHAANRYSSSKLKNAGQCMFW